MKNKMKEVTKLLGVELGEEFRIEDNIGVYKFTEDNCYAKYHKGSWGQSPYLFIELLTGRLKIATPEWKPEYGETYYMPALQYPVLYNRSPWENSAWDNHRWDNHLVYKTEEEAVEVSKRMLKALKEEQYDG